MTPKQTLPVNPYSERSKDDMPKGFSRLNSRHYGDEVLITQHQVALTPTPYNRPETRSCRCGTFVY